MRITIHQPNYLPYLGFFHKMMQCDIFVLLDNVDFVDNLYQQRNRIKTSQGWTWLTVPVQHGGKVRPKICEVRIAAEHRGRWGIKHWKSLVTNYGRAPYFKRYSGLLEDIYCGRRWEKLADLNETIIRETTGLLGIKKKFVRASDLNAQGEKSALLVNICKELGADEYLSGASGSRYMDSSLFEREGIGVSFHHYPHPRYRQCFGEFQPHMCMLDLMFNHGDESLRILSLGGDASLDREQGADPGYSN